MKEYEELNEMADAAEFEAYEEIEENCNTIDSKSYDNKCKKVEALLKAHNAAKQLELDSKKLDFEIEQAKKANDIEEKKLELEQAKVNIDAERCANEKKTSKKEFWLGCGKAVLGVAGIVASCVFARKNLGDVMFFETTNSVRTSAGKLALNVLKDSEKLLANTATKI